MLRSLFAAALALPLLLACSSTPAPTGGTGSTGSGSGGDGGAPADAGADASSPPDAAPDASDASACELAQPYSSKNAVCNACAGAHCCAEINACLLDPACNDTYVNCSLACALTDFDAGADAGINACLADCAAQSPKGKSEYDVAIGCADGACATECQ